MQKKSLRNQIFWGFTAILFLATGFGVYTFFSSQKIKKQASRINELEFPSLQILNHFNFKVEQLKFTFETAVLEDDEELLNEGLEFGQEALRMLDSIQLLEKRPTIDSLRGVFESYLENSKVLIEGKINGEAIDFGQMSETAGIFNWIQKIKKERSDEITQKFEDIKSNARFFVFASAVGALILLAFMILLFRYVSKVTTSIAKLSKEANTLQGGDLSHVIAVDRDDEIGELQGDFDSLRISLKDHIENLDAKVKEKTYQLEESKKKVDELLNTMSQAVFKIDEELIIVDPVSQYAKELFEEQIVGQSIFKTVFNGLAINSEWRQRIESAVVMVFGEDELQWSLACDGFPERIVRKNSKDANQVLRIKYEPIWNDLGELKEILMVCEDITLLEQLEAEKVNSEREILLLKALAAIDREDLQNFLEHSWGQILKELVELEAEGGGEYDWRMALNILHTIKGNSRVLGLENLASAIHDAESHFISYQGYGPLHEWEVRLSALKDLSIVVYELFNVVKTANHYFEIGTSIQNQIYLRIFFIMGVLERDLKIYARIPSVRSADFIQKTWERISPLLQRENIFDTCPYQAEDLYFLIDDTAPKIDRSVVHDFECLYKAYISKRIQSIFPIGEESFDKFAKTFVFFVQGVADLAAAERNDLVEFQEALFQEFSEAHIYLPASIWKRNLKSSDWVGQKVASTFAFFNLIIQWSLLEEFELKQELSIIDLSDVSVDALNIGGLGWSLRQCSATWMPALQKISESSSYFSEGVSILHMKFDDSKRKLWGQIFSGKYSFGKDGGEYHSLLSGSLNEAPLFSLNYLEMYWNYFYKRMQGSRLESRFAKINRKNYYKLRSLVTRFETNNVGESIYEEIRRAVEALEFEELKPMLEHQNELVNQLSIQFQKKVEFEVVGAELSIPKGIAYILRNALGHLIRNSLDHGIEVPAERSKFGKKETALLQLRFEVVDEILKLECSDDGKGLDLKQLEEKAIEFHLWKPNEIHSVGEIEDLVFLPRLSTKIGVTQISGRGVGLDSVRSEIQSVGGSVTVESVPGEGTRFFIHIPLSF